MIKKSNVTYDSNIYVLKDDFRNDKTFQSKVRGRKNLKAMLIELAGLRWVKGDVSVDNYTHLLTEVQQREWELGMYCALLGDKEEIVWGLVKEGDELKVACRCYKTDCRYFRTCRPDFEIGDESSALPEEQAQESVKNAQLKELTITEPTIVEPTVVVEETKVKSDLEVKQEVAFVEPKSESKCIDEQEKGPFGIFISRVRNLLEVEEKNKFQKIVGLIKELPFESSFESFYEILSSDEKAAILCRNRGEALKISGQLWKRQIPHTLKVENKRYFPLWVADLLSGFRGEISLEDFADMGETKARKVFNTLKLLCVVEGENLDCETVRVRAILNDRLPDEFFEKDIFNIVVSTVEQAKEQEFDHVYMIEPREIDLKEELEKEVNLWCNALTKTKKEFKWLKKQGSHLVFLRLEGKRWIEIGQERNGREVIVSLEVGINGDVDEESFVDGSFQGFDPYEVQEYIRNEVKPGDPLEIILIDRPFSVYGIYHRGKFIGRMSDSFMTDIKNVVETAVNRFPRVPRRFSEIFVENVYSVVKKPGTISPYVTQPYMSTGIWYGVKLSGMGKVRFD